MAARTQKAFTEWRPTRGRVIALARAGHSEQAAAITTGSGAEQVAQLHTQTRRLLAYALGKARVYHEEAAETKRRALGVTAAIALGALLLSVLVAAGVGRRVARAERRLRQ